MRAKDFQIILDRDLCCLHCGSTDQTLIPQHRINRGMGGSKKRGSRSNLIVLCSLINGLIESDADWAQTARDCGWKLQPWDDPLQMPVWDQTTQAWWMLDDQGYRRRADDQRSAPKSLTDLR